MKMFNFIIKKYEKKINELEFQIKNMNYEWNKEKELYDNETLNNVYQQKVDFVIGSIDIVKYKEIHRPLYGLTKIDAYKIADMVKQKLEEQGIFSSTSFHWREQSGCFVIDVQILDM